MSVEIPYVEVDAFLKQFGQGISAPILIIASDGNKYVLKNEKIESQSGWVEYNSMFFNELLAHQIARYLDVPTPDVAIVDVDPEHLNNGPSLRFTHRYHEGLMFASKEIEGNEQNLYEGYSELLRMGKPYISRSWKAFFSKISNGDKVAKIIAFDLLIANFDRFTNSGNLMVSNDGKRRMIHAIDHGHAFFGPIWDMDKVSKLRLINHQDYITMHLSGLLGISDNDGQVFSGLGGIFKSIEEYVDLEDLRNHSFIEVVKAIESINEKHLDEWFSNIPDEWYIDKKSQIAEHKEFILKQKNNIRIMIQELARRDAFTNFRGGILQWNESHVGTV